ncbi:hypothetical protein AB0903_07645 [Streptomyces sp. NPDC048389]|uniref:hypothetical protein n=1 Tax=Streptomyces sp. NPDC048389 TaxID=3154622 RepID=UPI003452B704
MPARTRAPRVLAATAAAAAAVGVLAACEPTAGGLNSAAVAVTTDRTATSTLERLTFDVAWLSCTARAEGAATPASGSAPPSAPSRATVDCQGETRSGQAVTVNGTVTEERAGKCVHGDLTAKVEKKIVFRATMLGDCTTAPSSTPAPSGTPTAPGVPRPAVTVTVTETVTETVTVVPAK